ncbi:MAG TPA: uracil-DNA glycosylase [Myxococcota bacterium]|nr:uracil-DNA glycosylase [Myxococcota bacterium]
MARSLTDEARELVSAARALLAEWEEDGAEAPPVAARPARAPLPPPARALPAPEPTPTPRDAPARAAGRSLDSVREELGECTRCRLHTGRTKIVFGDGNPNAELMFVGEGPGESEDLSGLPFVGRAGELLTRMIERGLGIPRSEVYICNIVKCRPPGNRTPLPDEVATCRRFLDGQIEAIAPRVIVTLGKPAASLLLGRDVSITKVRGLWHDYRGTPVMPTFHPAFLLRQYTEQNRRLVWEDLKAAKERAASLAGREA